MKCFLFITLLLISTAAKSQVEVWGDVENRPFSGGVQHLENGLGMGMACTEADREECEYADNMIEPYQYIDAETRQDFDHMTEELIFLEATRRSHQLTTCQGRLHSGYSTNPTTRSNMQRNAWRQFQDVRQEVSRLLASQRAAQESVDGFRNAYNFAEDRGNILHNEWRTPRLQEAQTNLAEINNRIRGMVSRIPMGNRPLMRELFIDLVTNNGSISEASFNQRFDGVMNELQNQIEESIIFYSKIIRPHGDGIIYSVNNDLKMNLVRTGQIDHVVSSLGMEERLARGFVCRTRARYETGPMARQILEIPLFLTGGYGLTRLALWGGSAALRATTAAGRIAARSAQAAAVASLAGIEAYEVTQDLLNSCQQTNYLLGSLDGNECTADSEINGVYLEADLAQCVTSAVLNLGPPTVGWVGGVLLRRTDLTSPTISPSRDIASTDANLRIPTEQRAQSESQGTRPQIQIQQPRFSEAANETLERTRRNIEGQRLQRYSNRESRLLALAPEDIRPGLRAALDRMHDKNFVSDYVRKLQEDTFERMYASQDTRLRGMLERGELDEGTMLEVLRGRVEARRANIVTIPPGAGELDTDVFASIIRGGYLIDYAQAGKRHGTYTHLIQQDLTYDIIARASGKSQQEVIEFFGTPNGVSVWGEMFDAVPDNADMPEAILSPIQPERFREYFIYGNLPLDNDVVP